MKKLSTQVILIIALVLLVGFVIVAGPSACSRMRGMAAQSRVDAAQSQAQAETSKDAVTTVANAGEAAAASEDLTRSNAKEVRDAKGADAPVSLDVGNAGLRVICRRATYADSPQCRLLKHDPAAVGKAR